MGMKKVYTCDKCGHEQIDEPMNEIRLQLVKRGNKYPLSSFSNTTDVRYFCDNCTEDMGIIVENDVDNRSALEKLFDELVEDVAEAVNE